MKKFLFLLMAALLVVMGACTDQWAVDGPNGNNPAGGNAGGNNDVSNPSNPMVIEYNHTGMINYSGPIAADPIFISRETVGSSSVEHYKLTWNACPINPNGLGLGFIRLSIPHVDKYGNTVYANGANDANYYFEGADHDWIYFKVVSLPNQTLKFNVAIKTANSVEWNGTTCKWFHHILPDDGVNNIYTITTQ